MTAQTRRRKFIAEARKKAYRDGQREREDQFHAWFRKAVKKAKKGDWGMLETGPIFVQRITIQCSADIRQLFCRAQHDLDEAFSNIEGPEFASEVVKRGREKLQK